MTNSTIGGLVQLLHGGCNDELFELFKSFNKLSLPMACRASRAESRSPFDFGAILRDHPEDTRGAQSFLKRRFGLDLCTGI